MTSLMTNIYGTMHDLLKTQTKHPLSKLSIKVTFSDSSLNSQSLVNCERHYTTDTKGHTSATQ